MSKSLNVFDIKFNGHHLVEAAAGTGKTYNITSLYVRALVEKELLPSQILVLTFTNDATTELKLRLRSRIQEIIAFKENEANSDKFVVQFANQLDAKKLDHLKNCLFRFDEAAISTIHGFCQRILTEHHLDFKVSPNLQLESNIIELIQEASDLFWDEFFFSSNHINEYKRWYLNRLNITFKTPDKLIDSIEELLLNSDIKIEPNLESFDDFEKSYNSSKSIFKRIKETYDQEKDVFLEFYHSEALNQNSYKNKKQKLNDFESWLHQEATCPPVYDKLNLFGSDMAYRFTKKAFSAPDLKLFKLVDEYIEIQRSFNSLETIFKSVATKFVRKNVEKIKKRRGVVGYQDLLLRVRDGLIESPLLCNKLVNRFPVAFIDEFQDTDHIQYSIFKSIYVNHSKSCLVLIGDPKQAIYRFRGADIHTYLAAKNTTPKENIYSLKFNFRSSRKLIEVVNSLFNGVSNPFKTDGLKFESAKFPDQREDVTVISQDEEIIPCKLIEFDSSDKSIAETRIQIAESVASEIIQLLKGKIQIDGNPLQQNDITILIDTHKNGELVQDILWEYGLKSTIRSKNTVYTSDVSQELYKLLFAIVYPNPPGYLKSALLTSLVNYDLKTFQLLCNDEERWNTLQSLFIDLHTKWSEAGLSGLLKSLEYEFQLFKQLATNRNPERSITNYKHLKELLLSAERNDSLSMFGVLRYFQNKMGDTSVHAPEDEVLRLETDDDLIQIVTHHASKGLEYNVVFCPFLWKFSIKSPKIPTLSDGFSETGVLDNESKLFKDALQLNKAEDEAERIRLVYVALTRAKSMCYIYHNGGRKANKSSGFNAIHHLISGNVELEKLKKRGGVIETKWLSILSDRIELESELTNQDFITDIFNREDLNNYKRWYSFSSISQHTKDTKQAEQWAFDYDEDARDEENSTIQVFDKFNLPKGKHTGNLLHGIFENIDFTNPNTFEPVITEQIRVLGFEERWKECLMQMVKESVKHELVDGVSLSKIGSTDKLVEMEFNFPLNQMDSSEFFKILSLVDGHSASKLNGYMKGFIDLIFRLGDKYYILDYKSNHLGDSLHSYSQDELSKEMKSARYNLQYHIYMVAFLRFIRLKQPGFNYSEHFGGVIYLFLRGVNSKESKSGVYFHKPEEEILSQLDKIIDGVEVN